MEGAIEAAPNAGAETAADTGGEAERAEAGSNEEVWQYSPLLLTALYAEGAEAAAAWREWRGAVDLQHLTWTELQMLAILNGPQLQEWLADDPASGVLKGIVRRAWTEAQVRLALARELTVCLEGAGCGPVSLIGSAGAYLRSLQTASIRPLMEIRLLIPREHVARAAEALAAEGWLWDIQTPPEDALDWCTHWYYCRNGVQLYLHWRVLPVGGEQAAACERAFLRGQVTVEAMGKEFRILNPAQALLEALSVRPGGLDVVPWQADAVLLLRQAIDWEDWAALATSFQRQAYGRLGELRAMGLAIPPLPEPPEEIAAPVAESGAAPAASPVHFGRLRRFARRGVRALGRVARNWRRRAGRVARRVAAAVGRS